MNGIVLFIINFLIFSLIVLGVYITSRRSSKSVEAFYNSNELCVASGNQKTCLNNTQLSRLKSLIDGGISATPIRASSVRFEARNNTWTMQPESGVAFVVRDNVSGGDKRHAFWKNRYRDL